MATANGHDAAAAVRQLAEDVSSGADLIEELLLGADAGADPAALRRLRALLSRAHALVSQAVELAEQVSPAPVAPRRRAPGRRRRGVAPDGSRDRPTWGGGWAEVAGEE
jgi:hypothetical protein